MIELLRKMGRSEDPVGPNKERGRIAFWRVYCGRWWFSRQLPHSDDPTVNLSGPVSASFGGNQSAVPSGSILQVRTGAPDVPTKYLGCMVSIDTRQRVLKAIAMKSNAVTGN